MGATVPARALVHLIVLVAYALELVLGAHPSCANLDEEAWLALLLLVWSL